MGHERNNVITAGLVAFVSWLLLTHAIPSLRWVPYAFVAGALTAILGLAYLLLTTSRPHRNGSRNAQLRAIPAFITTKQWEQEKAALKRRSAYSKSKIYPSSQKVSAAIDEFLGLILRDFVTVWYHNISTKPLFQNEVDRAIRDAAANIRGRLGRLDVVEIAVSRIVPIITNHMQDFYTAERLVRGKNLTRDMTESEELDLAIAGKYKEGRLHRAASLAFSDTKLMQQAHVRTTVARILPSVLSEDMSSSPAVTTLVREIVSCAVLAPIMLMLTDPDMWNQLLENFGRSLLHDRKTVRKLRAALDEHAPASPRGPRFQDFPKLKPNDTERQFERFIRAIRHTATLSEARRFRSEIASHLRKGASDPEQDTVYLRRLDAGKRILDQKIATLAAGGNPSARPKLDMKSSSASLEISSKLNQASLKEILRNASGLSYFMEFMDRRNKMRLVQFWIIIDGFRNPLEEDTDEPGYTLQEQATYNSADRMDIAMIKEAYLGLPELQVPDSARVAVHAYLVAGRKADMQQYIAARRSILKAQSAVYDEMKDEHFEAFRKSDLFYKWLATEEGSKPQERPDSLVGAPTRSASDLGAGPGKSPRLSNHPAVSRAKEPDLRRAAVSSSDLKSTSRPPFKSHHTRRSADDLSSQPLFDDDVEDERLTRSVPSLFDADSDNESIQREESAQVVNAMQSALDNIMGEPEQDSLFSDHIAKSVHSTNSPRNSQELVRPSLAQTSKPSIASLGLVGGPSAIGVFADDLFEDEEKFLEDEKEDSDGKERPIEDDIHEAAPGDLGLAEAIDALNAEVERLLAQESIVDSLTKKAELTNNSAELRILHKSKQSLQREVRRKEMQKQQYIVQESDNSLYGRAAVNIKSIMVGRDEDGHEFAIYVIEVRRQAGDQMPAATWTVARRYSEFHQLNKRLRSRFSSVRNLDFPRRQTIFTLQKDFLQKRRVALERYIRALLLIPAICRSRELRAFLSQSAISANGVGGTKIDQGDFVTRIYNSVSDGMEEFLGNLPVLDQLTVAGQNLISAASAQMNVNHLGSMDLPLAQDPATAAEAEAEIIAFEDREAEPFVKPICDLFLETFELQKGSSWLRGRAVVVVLHQLLGGTIERKVRDTAKGFAQDASVIRHLDMIKEMMWPGGQMRQPSLTRTNADKVRSKKEGSLLLATLVPDMAAGVVGRANAQAASRKMFAVLNNQRLNTHLVFTLFDEIVQIVFPEAIAH